MKIKCGDKWYDVLDIKQSCGIEFYEIEDKLNHIDWIANPYELILDEE